MRKLFSAFLLFFFPIRLVYFLLNLLGHNISPKAKFGFSICFARKITLKANARVGYFNLIKIDHLFISEYGYINRMNAIKGPFDIILKEKAAIGNSNVITRAGSGISHNYSCLSLGILSKITANHRIDCMKSISFADYSTLAGAKSQLWTHGYIHDSTGPGRYRIDGEIEIGNNVYIGSMCVINLGVIIADDITIGSGSSVSKSLYNKGLYVSQPLRYIEYDKEANKKKLELIDPNTVSEEVYLKKLR